MDALKTLFQEASENILVAGSMIFILIAFFAAFAEPFAALLPLAVGVGCYVLAYFKDQP
ncbi:MAG: hypothetical protein AB8B63_19305 [Granulosicoccus sp.]